MNIVITMAGLGSRFTQAGYTNPKFSLIANGKSLLQWSILSLSNFINDQTNLIFVALTEHCVGDYIKKSINHPHQLLEISQTTDGQATTALHSQNLWQCDKPLMIFNIDTFIHPYFLHPSMIAPNTDGWIPCMNAMGTHWSFVKLDEYDNAIKVAEKQRISPFASVGLYYFAKTELFTDAYRQTSSTEYREKYIAPLYNYLISTGKKIKIHNIDISNIHVLGTPKELEYFKSLNYQYDGESRYILNL